MSVSHGVPLPVTQYDYQVLVVIMFAHASSVPFNRPFPRTQARTKMFVTLGMILCGSLYSVFGGLIYRLSPTWLRKAGLLLC